MNSDRSLTIAWFAAITASVGDFLLLFVGNSLHAGTRLESSKVLLAMGGLLGCVAMPCYAFGYAALARVIRQRARITAAIMLCSAIAFGVVCSLTHGVTWMVIRSSMSTVRAGSSSFSPMESVVRQGGPQLQLWIIGVVVGLVLAIAIVRSGFLRTSAIPRWLAVLNPLTLTILIGFLSAFSRIGLLYILPMAPNVAHIVFFLALSRCLHVPESAMTARAAHDHF